MDLDSFAASSSAAPAPSTYGWLDPSSLSSSSASTTSRTSTASSSTTKRSRLAMEVQHQRGGEDDEEEMVAFKRLRIHRDRSEEEEEELRQQSTAAAPRPTRMAFPPGHLPQHQPPPHQFRDQQLHRQEQVQQPRGPASCPSSPTVVPPTTLQRHSSADVAAGGVVPAPAPAPGGPFPQQIRHQQNFHNSRTNPYPSSASSFLRARQQRHDPPGATTAATTTRTPGFGPSHATAPPGILGGPPSVPIPTPASATGRRQQQQQRTTDDGDVDYTPFNRLLGNLHQERKHRYLSQPPPYSVRFTDRTGLSGVGGMAGMSGCPDGRYVGASSGASSSMSSISTYGAEEASAGGGGGTGGPSHRVIRKILQTDSRLF